MMLWIPQKGTLRQQSNLGTLGAALPNTSVTSGGSAGAKTATPVQLLGSLNFDCYLLLIATMAHGTATALNGAYLDVMVGSAGNEDVLIPDLLVGHTDATISFAASWFFPVYIPAGSRISCRTASERASATMRVAIVAYGGHGTPPFRVASNVTAYGLVATCGGTSLTSDASTANEGAWTEITSGTSKDHFGFVPSVQLQHGQSDIGAATASVDFGHGGSGAEDPFEGATILCASNTVEYTDRHPAFPIYADIPSGTRIVGRVSASVASTVRDAAVYGLS